MNSDIKYSAVYCKLIIGSLFIAEFIVHPIKEDTAVQPLLTLMYRYDTRTGGTRTYQPTRTLLTRTTRIIP